MNINRDEARFIIDLLETDIYRRNETIRKVLDNSHSYIDDVDELKRRNVFARGIIAKLQDVQ